MDTSIRVDVLDRLRLLIVAGITTGVLVVGAGSRLAMFALRITSPDYVNGITSDDGFIIGRFTLSGTYNLLTLGASVGVIGAAAYRLVAPALVGPQWFRYFTVAAASGVVVGSMLIQTEGVDFLILKPTWFAFALFVALPALFGLAIAVVVDRLVAAPRSVGRRRWVVPVLLVAAFPLSLFVVGIAAITLFAWAPIRRNLPPLRRWHLLLQTTLRGAWLTVAVLGLVALVNDVRDLA